MGDHAPPDDHLLYSHHTLALEAHAMYRTSTHWALAIFRNYRITPSITASAHDYPYWDNTLFRRTASRGHARRNDNSDRWPASAPNNCLPRRSPHPEHAHYEYLTVNPDCTNALCDPQYHHPILFLKHSQGSESSRAEIRSRSTSLIARLFTAPVWRLNGTSCPPL